MFNDEKPFLDDREGDVTSHQFNFGDEAVDKYDSSMKEKYDQKLSQDKKFKKEKVDEELDFVSEAAENAKAQFEIDKLNMFGVALDEADALDFGKEGFEETNEQLQQKRKFLKELIATMDHEDINNDL